MLLTCDADNSNGAALRIFVAGAPVALPPDAAYERVLLLFDGRMEDEVAAARRQWAQLKGQGFALAYWQQNEDGRWERKM